MRLEGWITGSERVISTYLRPLKPNHYAIRREQRSGYGWTRTESRSRWSVSRGTSLVGRGREGRSSPPSGRNSRNSRRPRLSESAEPIVELEGSPARPHPFAGSHRRASAPLGADLELVHDPPDARQAQPEAPGGGEPVPHRQRDVEDPRPGVGGQNLDPAFAAGVDQPEDDLAARRVADDVPRQLRDRGRHEDAVGGGEAAPSRQLSPVLAGRHDVRVGIDGHPHLTRDERFPHASVLSILEWTAILHARSDGTAPVRWCRRGDSTSRVPPRVALPVECDSTRVCEARQLASVRLVPARGGEFVSSPLAARSSRNRFQTHLLQL